MDLSLRDRVVVVAASSEGIGKAIAHVFAREGARVVINGRRPDVLERAAEELRQATGASIEPVAGDLTQPAACQLLIDRAMERFGSLHALVTNAGGPPAMSFEALDDDAWYAALDLTLLSVVRLIRAALPHLRATRGSIVNITSTSVKQPIPGLVLSNTIRPGVVGLGKTLAHELADAGVRINDVGPGSIWTGRQEYLAQARAQREGIPLETVLEQAEAGIPMRRFGTPEEVANLVVFLSSSAASYITGTTVLVDGGANRGLM